MISRFLKNQIDDILSPEKILMYLIDLRTKVLWPDAKSTSTPLRHAKHRAYNAVINKIPSMNFYFEIFDLIL
jgi:hypothetical protein